MENKSSITALMSSFSRAFHAENEKHHVFYDDFAKKLMTKEEYDAVSRYIIGGAKFFELEMDLKNLSENEILRRIINYHLAPSPLCRSAYAENALKTAIMSGTKQYVILGAGLDTFALKNLDLPDDFKIYEVDHPLTQSDKIERIKRSNLQTFKNLTYVSVDFTTESLYKKLTASGFDKTAKTFFSWLGVTYYLSYEDTGKTLGELETLCENGSSLVFDYPDENFFCAPEKRVQNTILMAKAGAEEMKSSFSYERIEKLLEKHGFLIYELLYPSDIQKSIIDKSKADIKAFEHVNYCLAVKNKMA